MENIFLKAQKAKKKLNQKQLSESNVL